MRHSRARKHAPRRPPAPPLTVLRSTLHAGATQSVAIDISGDGHLPMDAASPGSSSPTHFDSLEVYLTSYAAQFNLTVSSGPGLLTQESGSTVKHINWLIDACIPSGNYNVRVPPRWLRGARR